ncbi:MAG: GIY-YIG nuclease family protein [Ignavibacteria bacterium]|nr:GIY-YIG nuclease family protein [Ignavibacteria bacterium]
MYILYSESLKKYYIGHSEDQDKRLIEHLTKSKHWTSRAKDWVVVYSETYKTRSEAMKRENEIKRLKNTKRFLESLN